MSHRDRITDKQCLLAAEAAVKQVRKTIGAQADHSDSAESDVDG
jgi:hypothetical protein